MDMLDLMKSRYSVRSYEPKKVEDDKLMKILEAGRIAPTAANMQPQRFLVIKSQEGLEKVNKAANTYNAPIVIIICGDSEKVWKRPFDGKDMVDIDTSIATDHMMLEAQSLGLGTCWITYFKKDVIQSEFNIPQNIEPVSILIVGYGNGKVSSPDRHITERKDLNEMLFYESF